MTSAGTPRIPLWAARRTIRDEPEQEVLSADAVECSCGFVKFARDVLQGGQVGG